MAESIKVGNPVFGNMKWNIICLKSEKATSKVF